MATNAFNNYVQLQSDQHGAWMLVEQMTAQENEVKRLVNEGASVFTVSEAKNALLRTIKQLDVALDKQIVTNN
jgi:hypothetical protein